MRGLFAFATIAFSACSSTESSSVPSSGDGGIPDASAGDGSSEAQAPTTSGAIACAGKTCDAASEVCCMFQALNDCRPKADCGGAFLACSGPGSCKPNEVCCGVFTASGGSAKCAASCDDVRLCATKDDCAGGEICVAQGAVIKICRSASGDGGGPPPPPDGG